MKKETRATKRMRTVEIGAGITAGIAGALVAGYLLYEKTKPQQAKAKAWAIKARAAAAREAKQLGRVGQTEYHRIMEKAMKHYGTLHKVNTAELKKALREAKAEWKHIKAEAKKAAGPVVKKAAKAPKRKP